MQPGLTQTQWHQPFRARLIEQFSDADDVPFYSWIEQRVDTRTGGWIDLDGGRQSDGTTNPAYELNGNTVTLPEGESVYAWMWYRGADEDARDVYEFLTSDSGGEVAHVRVTSTEPIPFKTYVRGEIVAPLVSGPWVDGDECYIVEPSIVLATHYGNNLAPGAAYLARKFGTDPDDGKPIFCTDQAFGYRNNAFDVNTWIAPTMLDGGTVGSFSIRGRGDPYTSTQTVQQRDYLASFGIMTVRPGILGEAFRVYAQYGQSGFETNDQQGVIYDASMALFPDGFRRIGFRTGAQDQFPPYLPEGTYFYIGNIPGIYTVDSEGLQSAIPLHIDGSLTVHGGIVTSANDGPTLGFDSYTRIGLNDYYFRRGHLISFTNIVGPTVNVYGLSHLMIFNQGTLQATMPGINGLTTSVGFRKPDGTSGTLTFERGLLTGVA